MNGDTSNSNTAKQANGSSDAFGELRRRAAGVGFDKALLALIAGHRVTRAGWNGRNQWIELQVPDRHSKMTLPYIFIRTVQGELVPWLASQTDLLATDWLMVVERPVQEIVPIEDDIPPRYDRAFVDRALAEEATEGKAPSVGRDEPRTSSRL